MPHRTSGSECHTMFAKFDLSFQLFSPLGFSCHISQPVNIGLGLWKHNIDCAGAGWKRFNSVRWTEYKWRWILNTLA